MTGSSTPPGSCRTGGASATAVRSAAAVGESSRLCSVGVARERVGASGRPGQAQRRPWMQRWLSAQGRKVEGFPANDYLARELSDGWSTLTDAGITLAQPEDPAARVNRAQEQPAAARIPHPSPQKQASNVADRVRGCVRDSGGWARVSPLVRVIRQVMSRTDLIRSVCVRPLSCWRRRAWSGSR